jgi:hypothetical protein
LFTLIWKPGGHSPAISALRAPPGGKPSRQCHDHAAAFGHADEFGRIQQSAGRMLPAHQRFRFDDGAAGQVDNRLVRMRNSSRARFAQFVDQVMRSRVASCMKGAK